MAEAPTIVRLAGPADRPDWMRLRQALWQDEENVHAAEIAAMLAEGSEAAGLLALAGDGMAVGFAEVALRHDYVNGCETSPVGFLEGIYVVPEKRRGGVARLLVAAAADWARRRGCTELASDADINNTISHRMHQAVGFTETRRMVFYRMVL